MPRTALRAVAPLRAPSRRKLAVVRDERPGSARYSAAEVQLARTALKVVGASLVRVLRMTGAKRTALDTDGKRRRRLIAKLRPGVVPIRRAEAEYIARALIALGWFYRMTEARPGDLDREFEAAMNTARRFAAHVEPPAALRRLGDKVPESWAIGTRLVERATGAEWWVDEFDAERPDLVGVIPDVGSPKLRWMPRRALERAPQGGANDRR